MSLRHYKHRLENWLPCATIQQLSPDIKLAHMLDECPSLFADRFGSYGYDTVRLEIAADPSLSCFMEDVLREIDHAEAAHARDQQQDIQRPSDHGPTT